MQKTSDVVKGKKKNKIEVYRLRAGEFTCLLPCLEHQKR